MKTTRVLYQVKPEFVEQNKANIRAVMDDLRQNPIEGFIYSSHYFGDGKFMHFSMATDESAAEQLNQREAFNSFRAQVKGSEPIEPPKSEYPELVGSNVDMF